MTPQLSAFSAPPPVCGQRDRRHRVRPQASRMLAVVICTVAVATTFASAQPVSSAAPIQPAATSEQTPRQRETARAKTQRTKAALGAEQETFRSPEKKTVTVKVGDEGVPEALWDATVPMTLRQDETLVVQNDTARALSVRLVLDVEPADALAPAISVQGLSAKTATAKEGPFLEWTVAELTRIAGKSETLGVQIVPTDGEPDFSRDVAYFRLRTTEPTPDEMRTKGIPLTFDGPPATIAAPDTRLQLASEQAIVFNNITRRKLQVTFLDLDPDVGACPRAVEIQPGQPFTLPADCLRPLAGKDRLLSFDVRIAGVADRLLGTGYVGLPGAVLTGLKGEVIIPLDVTGVAEWRLLNPRAARTIDPNSTPPTTLVFVSRVPGRTVIVTFPAIKRDLAPRFREAGFIVKCNRPATCVPTLQLQGASRTIGGKLMIDAYSADEGLVQFRVSFFEGDLEPANPLGYFRVRPEDFEPGFSSIWNVIGTAGFVRDAYFEGFPQDVAKAPVIDDNRPFRDQHRWHLAGNVRLVDITQLGSRATAEVELIVKDKDFGVSDSPTVTTQKARVNAFGLNDVILSVGRFDFAAPTRGLAIAESGEGVLARWRFLSFSYIVRPRDAMDVSTAPAPPAGTPPVVPAVPAATERWSALQQIQIPAGPVRIETSVLAGRRKTFAGGEGYYRTLGFDAIFAGGAGQREGPDGALQNDNANRASRFTYRVTGGAYWSHRQARASDVSAPKADSGKSGLIDASVSKIGAKGTPLFTLGTTLARASRDDPDTPHDEGYVGESTAFGPDKIFLSTLAAKFGALDLATPDAGGQPRLIRRGLSGKSYQSAGFVWHTFSPLYGIIKILHVPSMDVELQSTSVRWQSYSLVNEVASSISPERTRRNLGQELVTEFLLESPKAVRYSVTAGLFDPGRLLRDQQFVTHSTWFLDARVTVTLR